MRFCLMGLSLVLIAGCSIKASEAEDFSGNGFDVEGGKVSLDDSVPQVSCSDGDSLQWTNGGWACAAGGGGVSSWNDLSDRPADLLDGDDGVSSWNDLTDRPTYLTDGDDDALGALGSCTNSGEVVAWNGSAWACSTEVNDLGAKTTLSDLPSCSDGHVPTYNGSSWSCAAPPTAGTTLDGLGCAKDGFPKFNGANWACEDYTLRHTLVVGASGGASPDPTGSGDALLTALQAVRNGTPTVDDPWTIELGPGVFDVGVNGLIIDIDGVHIHGAGRDSTRIISSTATDFNAEITGNGVELSDLTIEAGGVTDIALVINACAPRIRNVGIVNSSTENAAIGIRSHADASPVFENLYVSVTGGSVNTTGMLIQGGTVTIANSVVDTSSTASEWSTTIDVRGSTTYIRNSTLSSSIAAGSIDASAVYSSSAATVVISDSHCTAIGSSSAHALGVVADNSSVVLTQSYCAAHNATGGSGLGRALFGVNNGTIETRNSKFIAAGSDSNTGAGIASGSSLEAYHSIFRVPGLAADGDLAIDNVSGTVFAGASQLGGELGGSNFNCINSWNHEPRALDGGCN